jgi:hypothetical protein
MTMTEAAPVTDEDITPARAPSIAPAIFEAIRAVSSDLGPLAKSGEGPRAQGGYPFLPVDKIVEAISPLFSEYGVVVRVESLEEQIETDLTRKFTMAGEEIRDGSAPNARTRARVRMRYVFTSSVDGSEFPVTTAGEAHDVADKAVGKAETAAYKKALLRTFTVVSGEKDADEIDPNEEDAARAERTGRRNRGEQRRDKARGTAGRTPPPTAPAPEPKATGPAEPIEQHDAHEPEADDEAMERQVAVARQEFLQSEQPAPGARRRRHGAASEPGTSAPASDSTSDESRRPSTPPTATPSQPSSSAPASSALPAPSTVTEAKAQQQEQTWRPDQADIDAAEHMSPATEQHLAGNPPRVDAAFIPAPAAEPAPVTRIEQKAEDLAAAKSNLRRAWSSRGMTREQVNVLGDEVTGKPRTEWMMSVAQLRKVLAAVEAGQVAKAAE